MKKLTVAFALSTLLSSVPLAFAAENNVPALNTTTPSLGSVETSQSVRPESQTSRDVEDQSYRAGDLRSAGLYMGPDGVLHYVPTQDARLKLY